METTTGSEQNYPLEVRDDLGSWTVIVLDDRVDSFNYDPIKERISQLVEVGQKNMALDLRNARFLSLTMIKFLSAAAEDLSRKGRQMALVAPSEKLKRQIDIFATLENMRIYRTPQDLRSEVRDT